MKIVVIKIFYFVRKYELFYFQRINKQSKNQEVLRIVFVLCLLFEQKEEFSVTYLKIGNVFMLSSIEKFPTIDLHYYMKELSKSFPRTSLLSFT